MSAPAQKQSPVVAGGLELGLASVLDLEGEGVALTGAGGAVGSADGVELRVSGGDALSYNAGRKGVSGVIGFDGALQFAKGGQKVVVSALSFDIASGSITGTVGDTVIEIATLVEPHRAEVVKEPDSPRVRVIFGQDGLVLSSGLPTALDAALGSGLAEAAGGDEFEGKVDVAVNVIHGDTVDTALATALGLGDLDLDLDTSLGLDVGLS
ncbi:hypothetical protein ACIBEK_24365 [Nocardia fusca]|uniref:hypothetical protein n=1 Tax=Nocardia fusca TaxID=941183 RepID=UPI00378EA813